MTPRQITWDDSDATTTEEDDAAGAQSYGPKSRASPSPRRARSPHFSIVQTLTAVAAAVLVVSTTVLVFRWWTTATTATMLTPSSSPASMGRSPFSAPASVAEALSNAHLRDNRVCPDEARRMALLPFPTVEERRTSGRRRAALRRLHQNSNADAAVVDVEDDEGLAACMARTLAETLPEVYIIGLPGTGGPVVRRSLEALGYTCVAASHDNAASIPGDGGDALGEMRRVRWWQEILATPQERDATDLGTAAPLPKFVLTVRPTARSFATSSSAAWRTSALGPSANDAGAARFAAWRAAMAAQGRISRRGAPWEREQEAWAFLEAWLAERHDTYARSVLATFFPFPSPSTSDTESIKSPWPLAQIIGRRGGGQRSSSSQPSPRPAWWSSIDNVPPQCRLLTLAIGPLDSSETFVDALGLFTGAQTERSATYSVAAVSEDSRRRKDARGGGDEGEEEERLVNYPANAPHLSLASTVEADIRYLNDLGIANATGNARPHVEGRDGDDDENHRMHFSAMVAAILKGSPGLSQIQAQAVAAEAVTRDLLAYANRAVARRRRNLLLAGSGTAGATSTTWRGGALPPAPWVVQDAYLDVMQRLPTPRVRRATRENAGVLAAVPSERLLDDVFVWPFFCTAQQYWPDRHMPRISGRAIGSVAYVTHGSIDRLDQLKRRIDRWRGPASIAVYVEGGELAEHDLERGWDMRARQRRGIARQLIAVASECMKTEEAFGRFADVHVVARIPSPRDLLTWTGERTEMRYPFNALRNAAMANVRRGADFVLAIDADAAIGGGLRGGDDEARAEELRVARTLATAVAELAEEGAADATRTDVVTNGTEGASGNLRSLSHGENMRAWTIEDEEHFLMMNFRTGARLNHAADASDGTLFVLASFEPSAATIRRAARPDVQPESAIASQRNVWADPIEELADMPELVVPSNDTIGTHGPSLLLPDGEAVHLQPMEHNAMPEAYEIAADLPRYLAGPPSDPRARHRVSYPIAYRCMFEPYFITRVPSDPAVRLPAFDERFVGRYFDKTSHAFETCRMPAAAYGVKETTRQRGDNGGDNDSAISHSNESSNARQKTRHLLQRLQAEDSEHDYDDGPYYASDYDDGEETDGSDKVKALDDASSSLPFQPAFRFRVLRRLYVVDNGRVSTLESISHLRRMKTLWDEHTLRAMAADSDAGTSGALRHRRCACSPEHILRAEMEPARADEVSIYTYQKVSWSRERATWYGAPTESKERTAARGAIHVPLRFLDSTAGEDAGDTLRLALAAALPEPPPRRPDAWSPSALPQSMIADGESGPTRENDGDDEDTLIARLGGHCHRLNDSRGNRTALARSFALRLAAGGIPSVANGFASSDVKEDSALTPQAVAALSKASEDSVTAMSAGASVPMLKALSRAMGRDGLPRRRGLRPTAVAELAPMGGDAHRQWGRKNLLWLAQHCPVLVTVSAFCTRNATVAARSLVPWRMLTREEDGMRFLLGSLELDPTRDALAVTLALSPHDDLATNVHAHACASRFCDAAPQGNGVSASSAVVRLSLALDV